MKKLIFAIVLCFCAVPALAQSQGVTCDKSTTISVSSGATGEIIAPQSDATIYVCGFVISADTIATTAQFKTGTGTTCGTGTVNKTAAMRLQDEGNISHGGAGAVIFQGTHGAALCLTTVTGAISGFITYRQQ